MNKKPITKWRGILGLSFWLFHTHTHIILEYVQNGIMRSPTCLLPKIALHAVPCHAMPCQEASEKNIMLAKTKTKETYFVDRTLGGGDD